MVSDYGGIHPQGSGSPHIPQLPSPSYSYFTEEVRFGSYMGPELGRIQGQHFQGDRLLLTTRPRPHPHPHRHRHRHPHPHPLHSLPYAHDMHEAILRELEKERIREEIIMSEMRRRELEAEVRRELMMERELGIVQRRGSDGHLFAPPSIMEFDLPMRRPVVESRAVGRSLEDRRVISPFADEPLPFQRGSAEARNSAMLVSEGAKEKEKKILLVKPSEDILAVKRGASVLASWETLSESNTRKKAKGEWSCAICQVSTTSEPALNEHLQGKKHKLKEAGLRAQVGGKSYSIGLYPKKAAKATTVDASSDNEVKVASQSLPSDDKTEENSSKTDDRPLLEESPNSVKVKENIKPAVAEERQKDCNLLKKKFRFWCEVCHIGCHSPKVLNTHLEGKKHKRQVDMRKKDCPSEEKNNVVDEAGPLEEEAAAEDGENVVVNEPVDHDLTKVDVGGEDKDS